MPKKRIRKYPTPLIEVHVTALRNTIATMNHVLSLPGNWNVEAIEEERSLFVEMIDWLEARRDLS